MSTSRRTKAQRDAELDEFFAHAEDILTDWEPGYDALNSEMPDQTFRYESSSPPPLASWDDLIARNERVLPANVALTPHPNCRTQLEAAMSRAIEQGHMAQWRALMLAAPVITRADAFAVITNVTSS